MKDKDPNIDQLFQDGDKVLPPKAIDEAIMAQAEQAHRPKTRLGRLRPWLAAASVLLTVPILWLMVHQPELQQVSRESIQPEPVPSITQPADRAQPDIQDNSSSDDLAGFHDSQDQESDQGKITVTGSRIRHHPSTANSPHLKTEIEPTEEQDSPVKKEAKSRADRSRQKSAKPAPAKALDDNLTETEAIQSKQPLMIQLTDIITQTKPEPLNPRQSQQWTQLEQQIVQQQWQQAQESIKSLKQSHPDFDFSALEKILKQLSSP